MKRFTWRAFLYAFVLGYLFLDLRVCHGPLREAMRSRRDAAVAAAREQGWVALVNLEPITREQLDLAVARHLHQRGRDAPDLPEKALALVRKAVLQSLVDETLVRQHADGDRFVAPAAESAAFAAAWRAGFSSAEELEERAAGLGIDPAGLDAELARIWSRKRWLERRLEPGVDVTEEEVREWFEANRLDDAGSVRPGFYEPESAKVRLLRLPADAGELAREWHAALLAGASPATLPPHFPPSDEAPTDAAGSAVWLARESVSPALAEALFAEGASGWLAPVREPSGWTLAELLEHRSERPLDYEELRDEIHALLTAERREIAFRDLREKLRKVANWQIFPENL